MARPLPDIDWRVVLTAASAGLMVVIPAAILAAVAVSDDDTAAWAFVFTFVALIGFTIAGFGAGRLRRDTPMLHGSLAALACYAVVQGFGLIRRLLADESINFGTYPLSALLAASCGVAGALFADWYLRRVGRVTGG